MSVDEVLKFLGSRAPGDDIFGPTADGLGAALSAVVSLRPVDYAVVAGKLKGLDPTSFLAGVAAALKAGKKWEWGPVLELARLVVTQRREI
jgi:hypothetical protein